MAVSALEKACFERKNNIPILNEPQKKSMMNYTSKAFFKPAVAGVAVDTNAPINFDNYEKGFDYAML